MQKEPWEIPNEIEAGTELKVVTHCHNAALAKIYEQGEKIKELISRNNRAALDIENYKTKLNASQDHYDTLLEKILDKIK